MERFRSLPPEKRQELRLRFHELRELPPDERMMKRRELREELQKEGVVVPRERR